MKGREISMGWVAVAVMIAVSGCNSTTKPDPVKSPYASPSAPESVVYNFRTALQLKDPAGADSLMASDFVFRFQLQDILQGAPDSLARAPMDSFFVHLFVEGKVLENPPASTLTLNYVISSLTDDALPGHAGWKVGLVNTTLMVNFPNGNEIEINSPVQFRLRQQPAGSNRWRIVEWQELSGGGGKASRGAIPAYRDIRASTTWGRLISTYR